MERSVEVEEVENEEEIDGDVWEFFVVIGETVKDNTVGFTEVFKPVEMGCGDGEEWRKILLSWVDRKKNGEVVLASVLLSNTTVTVGVVEVVALVWSTGHRTQI